MGSPLDCAWQAVGGASAILPHFYWQSYQAYMEALEAGGNPNFHEIRKATNPPPPIPRGRVSRPISQFAINGAPSLTTGEFHFLCNSLRRALTGEEQPAITNKCELCQHPLGDTITP